MQIYITTCCNYPSRLFQCSVNNTSMHDELEKKTKTLLVQAQIYQGKVLLLINWRSFNAINHIKVATVITFFIWHSQQQQQVLLRCDGRCVSYSRPVVAGCSLVGVTINLLKVSLTPNFSAIYVYFLFKSKYMAIYRCFTSNQLSHSLISISWKEKEQLITTAVVPLSMHPNPQLYLQIYAITEGSTLLMIT